jgi:cell division protein FtsL
MNYKTITAVAFILLLLFISYAIPQTTQTTTVDQKIQSLEGKVQNIEKENEAVKVSKEYFGYVLTVFTTIILAIIGLFVLIQWWQMGKSLQSNLDKQIHETADKLQAEFLILKESNQKSIKESEDKLNVAITQSGKDSDDKTIKAFTQLKDGINDRQKKAELKITFLKGQTSRTFASQLEDAKQFEAAFIWWIRGADDFIQTNNTKLAKIALKSAITCLGNIDPPLEFANIGLDTEMIRLLAKIKESGHIYTMEVEQIEKLYKEKKYPGQTQEEES